MHTTLWWISLPWATFGLVSEQGRVAEVAPIAGWAEGRPTARVLSYFRRRGATVIAVPLSAEQVAEIAYHEQVAGFCDMHAITAGGKRIVNRTTLFEMRKQRFVEAFISEDRIADYPCDEADVADETRDVDHTGMRLSDAFVAEVRRAFLRCAGPSNIDPAAVATELLRSEHGAELHTLSRMPLSDIQIPLILGHLEALAFGLDKRLSATIARRAFLLLLNQRHFLPDARPDKT